MDTQERLQTADALLYRARELMKEVENPQNNPDRRDEMMWMAHIYAGIAEGYHRSYEVRQL